MKILRWLGGIVIFGILGSGAWVVFHSTPEAPPEGGSKIATEVAVKSAPLVRTTLHQRVTAFGVAQPEPASEGKPAAFANLVLPSGGLITEVSCVEGQSVKKGDVLVSLDARVDQSRLEQAQSALEFATQEYDRQKQLLTIDGASLKSVQGAENELHKAKLEVAAAETALGLLRIEAPISGVISKVNVRRGEAADTAVTAIELIDPARLVLSVPIPAPSAAQVKSGQRTTFFREGTALDAEGKVSFVSSLVNAQTGAVEVRITIPSEAGIHPGEWLEVRIVSEERKDILAAPIESVTSTEDAGSVIALIQGDTASQVPVKTGVREGGLVEVEGEGLSEGSQVVTQGAYGLPQETKVRILTSE